MTDDDPDCSVRYAGLSFDLTYAHAPGRLLTTSGADGPGIPNAYDTTELTAGEWSADIDDYDGDARKHVLGLAVSEAVHEALEWAQQDHRPLLNPHGVHENRIHRHVAQLVEELWALIPSETTTGHDRPPTAS